MRNPNTFCKDCQKPVYRRPSELKKWDNVYCSVCKKSHMKEFAISGNDVRYVRYIKMWKNGKISGMKGKYSISNHIKRYLFKKYDNKCCKCSWSEINKFTNKIPLEIEHIDGDFTNNKEENLLLLCPNCHSLTPTYKGANRGNGRKERNVCRYSSVGQSS